jgi:hypothetical protein
MGAAQFSLIEGGKVDPDVQNVDAQLEAIAVDIEMTQSVAALRIGQRLAEARDLFRYKREVGGFQGWVQSRLGMSDRQAHRLIAVYERLGGKSDEFIALSREALFQLAAPSTPEPVRQEVERLLVDGQPVTAADIKRLRKHLALTVVEITFLGSSERYDPSRSEDAVMRKTDHPGIISAALSEIGPTTSIASVLAMYDVQTRGLENDNREPFEIPTSEPRSSLAPWLGGVGIAASVGIALVMLAAQ